MLDFAVIKELVKKHIVAYSLYTDTQELSRPKCFAFDVLGLNCKLFLAKMCLNHTH